eukprot:391437-Amorphochlora_amoeboformis.AAC.1
MQRHFSYTWTYSIADYVCIRIEYPQDPSVDLTISPQSQAYARFTLRAFSDWRISRDVSGYMYSTIEFL